MAFTLFYTTLSPVVTADHWDHGRDGGPLDSSIKGFEISHFYFQRNQGDAGAPLSLGISIPDGTNLPAFLAAFNADSSFDFSLAAHRQSDWDDGPDHFLMMQIDGIGAKVTSVFCEDDDSGDPASISVDIEITSGMVRSFTQDPNNFLAVNQFAATTI